MNRAILTFALGEYERLAEVSRPSIERYAEAWDYVLLDAEAVLETWTDELGEPARPASWLKLPLLHAALGKYGEVLWLDADVIVVDDSRDLADELSPDDWQALVRHHTPDGEVPNCGVWLLRPPMRPLIERVWFMTQYLKHPWWEQGALCELLGYGGKPLSLLQPSELYARTCWLELEWNSHEEQDPHPSPRFAHATAGPLGWRLQTLHRYADRIPAGKGA